MNEEFGMQNAEWIHTIFYSAIRIPQSAFEVP
jgi:hypothetical protein